MGKFYCQILMANGSEWIVPDDPENEEPPALVFDSYDHVVKFFVCDLLQFINNANDDGWGMNFYCVRGFKAIPIVGASK